MHFWLLFYLKKISKYWEQETRKIINGGFISKIILPPLFIFWCYTHTQFSLMKSPFYYFVPLHSAVSLNVMLGTFPDYLMNSDRIICNCCIPFYHLGALWVFWLFFLIYFGVYLLYNVLLVSVVSSPSLTFSHVFYKFTVTNIT